MSPLFFFNDTATTEIYTLSLHDALPICCTSSSSSISRSSTCRRIVRRPTESVGIVCPCACACRSEEHTSELQSRLHLVCRLLLEKKKNKRTPTRQPARQLIPCMHSATTH